MDGAVEDRFGMDVAISGNTALIGSRWDDDNGSESGSAYVFVRQSGAWIQQAKLTPDDGAAVDWFGSSVALSGDTALIGASRDGDIGVFSGSAYVFVREGEIWSQQAKLLAGDGAAEDWFGQSVALQADTALIGADLHDHNGADSGSAYVFVRSGNSWSQQAELVAADAVTGDRFGFSVSLSEGTALVGAIGDDSSTSNAGSAYVFVRRGTEWTQQAELLAGDGASNDWYGWSVAVSQDTALVGAPRDDDNGTDSGAGYVFSRSGDSWLERPKLLAADGMPGDRLGISVALSGEHALIGAYLADSEIAGNAGLAWIFTGSGGSWTERARLLPSDPWSGALFGVSVSLSGKTAVIGAGEDSQNGYQSGSAYLFGVPLIFEDGFESRDTSAWSVTVP